MLVLPVAPPLSVEEVLKAVTGVNWRKLGKELLGEYEYVGRLVDFGESDPKHTNLDRIYDEHESDEARLRAVVEQYLYRPVRSWRRVIWALYCIDELDKAQKIRSYAEPLQGMIVYNP